MSDLIQGDAHQGTDTCVSVQGQRKEKVLFCSSRAEKGKKSRRLHWKQATKPEHCFLSVDVYSVLILVTEPFLEDSTFV